MMRRSEKLQPFWLSLSAENKRKFMNLSEILLSQEPSIELRKATQRALSCNSFRPIPFFGTFLKDLYTIFQSIPSLVPGEKAAEDRDNAKAQQLKLKYLLVFSTHVLLLVVFCLILVP
ncbi:hypothetical protein D918_00367 [Trichuris suis]|nr:hypothetical protein D918_00367 [Trichuris suis]